MKKPLLFAISSLLLFSCGNQDTISISELKAHFANPPRESRPMVWWHWMDGNITKDGIRKDLEWMDRAGIRGFHLFDAGLWTPQIVDERLAFMTPEWKDAFRYALEVADSLDMEVGIASSPGWSHTGGPWVKPEDGMKKVVWREMEVEGGKFFQGPLPEPFAISGPFQDVAASEHMTDERQDGCCYGDIAVVALRIPEEDRALVPSSVKKYENASDGLCGVIYSFDKAVTVRSVTVADGGGREDISFRADGREVCIIAPSSIGEQTVSFPPVTGRMFSIETKPSEPGLVMKLLGAVKAKNVTIKEFRLTEGARINASEAKSGFVALAGLQDYLTPEDEVERATAAIDLTDKVKDGILSWDVPEGRWKLYRFGWSLTGKMNAPASAEATGLEVDKLDPDAWERYFGQYLAMYRDAAGGSMDKIDYILTDSWEAGCENWTPRLREEFLARRGYDLIPWLPVLTGVIIGTAEASEKFLLDWRETLSELVAENFDRLAGIARENGLKGRYSESHENGRALVADGMDLKRKADVPMSAIWTPGPVVGVPVMTSLADMRESASVSHIYGQQYVAAESMTAVGLFGQAYSYYPGNLKPVVDLEFASGVNRIVIHESAHQPSDEKVPGLSLSITGQWFNRHETWAEQARPWTDYLARTSYMLSQGKIVADILIFYGDDTNITARYGHGELEKFPKGYNYDFVNSYALLNAISYKKGRFTAPSGNSWKVLVLDADVISDEAQAQIDEWRAQGARICALSELPRVIAEIPADIVSSDEINYVHRSVADGEYYWVSNLSDDFATIDLSFRTKGRHVSVWDPETGEISACEFTVTDDRTLVTWAAQPHDAKFFVFSNKEMAGQDSICHPKPDRESVLPGPWHISFQEGRGAPAEVVFDTLHSFSEDPDPGVRYFSGTATYSKEFTIDRSDERAVLSLGDVQNIAEVIVNDKNVRTLWKVPYEVEITDYLKEGTNYLVIRVTNLWPNHLIGDAGLPEAERLTYTGFPLYSPDDALRPAGLIGPVSLKTILSHE